MKGIETLNTSKKLKEGVIWILGGGGMEWTWIEPHPYTIMGHRIRGTLQLEGKRGNCHVLAQGVPTWVFVAESLKLNISGIWCQVKEIMGWCKLFYPGMDIGTPLVVAWDRRQR